MKLRTEQIRFIDTYLQNSEVVYVDIRLEMIDHIATAIEEKMEAENVEFYDAFKDYMIRYKNEILKNNKERWFVVVFEYLKFLMHPFALTLLIGLFMMFSNTDFNSCISKDFSFRDILIITTIFLGIFRRLYINFYIKRKFFSIDRTGNLLELIFWVCYIFLFRTNEKVSAITATIFSFLLIGYIVFFIREVIKFNKHRFNFI